jgi:hypothetical protein
LSPVSANIGNTASRVNPGYVVLSTMTSSSRWSVRLIASAADSTAETSGSCVLLSGVGTQIDTASHAPSFVMSVVAAIFPLLTRRPSTSLGTSAMYDRPLAIASTLRPSISNAVTLNPHSANRTDSGSPTYPAPITPMEAPRDAIFSLSVMRSPLRLRYDAD